MVLPSEQIEELKAIYGAATAVSEGDTQFVHFAALPLPKGCDATHVEALLCPSMREGYPSRLYMAEIPKSPTRPNWHMQVRILEKNWHVYSLRVPDSGQRLAQLVQQHLAALR